MSQAEIQKFLSKHKGKWFTVKELADKLNIGPGSCSTNLRRLIKHRLIKKRDSKTQFNVIEYSLRTYYDRKKSGESLPPISEAILNSPTKSTLNVENTSYGAIYMQRNKPLSPKKLKAELGE